MASLTWDGGEYPLNHVVLAGELLYTEPDYIMSLKSPAQVRDIAAALPAISEDHFRVRYFAIDPESYDGPLSEEDFGYTWEWFQTAPPALSEGSGRGAACLVYRRPVRE